MGCLYLSVKQVLNTKVCLEATPLSSEVNLSVKSKNSKVSVKTSLLCSTGIGQSQYLAVFEGYVITIDGQYMKVLRK